MAARSFDERRIMQMFSYMRPAGSREEQLFVDAFLTPLGFERDAFKNLVLRIGDAPRILWSSHLDTVHAVPGRQTLHYDGHILSLSRAAKRGSSTCLGADDTAGIWLMTEMIRAGVEGLYVIHHAEEKGCIGSAALAKDPPPGFFDGIEAAIAFDRMGYASVITHQSAGKTASDAFALSLAGVLGGSFDADDTGVYTDTNEYASIIPECTNVSVGYFDQHTTRETQDVQFLLELRDALVSADFSQLVIERKPGDDGWADRGRRWYGYYADEWDRDNLGYSSPSSGRRYDGLEGYVRAYPEIAAQLLQAMGISEGDFRSTLIDFYGEVDDPSEEDDDEEDGYSPFDRAYDRRAA